jgi:hypothetical protein
MSIERPSYIPQHISAREIRHEWNEWEARKYYAAVDEAVLEKLSKSTGRAIRGLTIASAEWIAFRFENLYDHPLRIQYLLDVFEAAWAANIDLAYCQYFETNDDDWRGAILGPSNLAVSIVMDSLFCADEISNPAESPMWMANLVQHVIDDKFLFRQWFDDCIERINKYYLKQESVERSPVVSNETAETPIARAFFDPLHAFRPDTMASLANAYLSTIDYQSNPFLRSPEELQELGFEGTPYAFK